MHHAYLLIADTEAGIAHARALFAFGEDGHPDVEVIAVDSLSIEAARSLKERAQQRPVSAPRRLFIIAADTLMHEAQNALLKLFEEPPRTSAFVLIMDREDRLIPTLRSRVEVVRLKEQPMRSTASDFLSLSYGERLKEIAARTKNKDEGWQRALLTGLEPLLRHDPELLRTLVETEAQISARGSSPKMLLEHLALTLPRSLGTTQAHLLS